MNRAKPASLFIGSPIEHAAEREALHAIADTLDAASVAYVILANVELGRQIDLLVATARSVMVLEVKSTRAPIRGEMNGEWERLDYSGKWARYGNAYRQAVSAKHALRDAMNAFKPAGAAYPAASVVYVGGLPDGSSVTKGDFKCQVTDLTSIQRELVPTDQAQFEWALTDWIAFAHSLGLEATSVEQVLQPARHQAASAVLEQYNRAIITEYEPDARRWLTTPEEQSALLAEATRGHGCVLTGPSGCGKTLMGKWVTVSHARAGDPVVYLAASSFDGNWGRSLQREFALLSDITQAELTASARTLGKPLLLVLDGVNELGPNTENALRGLNALARRLNARIALTTQGRPPERFSGLTVVQVGNPDAALKARIAERAGGPVGAGVREVLKAVTSGMEAEMVGRVGAELVGDVTRLTLVDQYIRQRLGAQGRAGVAGLRKLALTLHRQWAYSLSESAFDELMKVELVSFEVCDAMMTSGLLVRRSGRIAFGHEILLSGCAAFGLAAEARERPEKVGDSLSTSAQAPIATDLIAALDDTVCCEALLRSVTDRNLLARTADGASGALAASIAQRLLEEARTRCEGEILNLALDFNPTERGQPLSWRESTKQDWTVQELARLGALGIRSATADGVGVYLGLCQSMDRRLAVEVERLEPEARAHGMTLRSGAFALAYYAFGDKVGFSQIGHQHRRRLDADASPVGLNFNPDEMSSGQLHFLFDHRAIETTDDRLAFAKMLIHFFRTRFRTEPYHVQLVALGAVGFARPEDADVRLELIGAIESLDHHANNWGIGSSIIDALGMLGALDDEAEDARQGIRTQVAHALSDDPLAIDGDFALTIYVAMFDHPFSAIYYEEVHGLPLEARHRLYRRALAAPTVKRSLSLRWLCEEVVGLMDPGDSALLVNFAGTPDRTSVFPQDEWAAFTLSTRFLGRHGVPLPAMEGTDDSTACLRELRTVIHATEAGTPEAEADARNAWLKLRTMSSGLVVGCFSDVHDAMTDRGWGPTDKPFGRLDLTSIYQTDALALARRFVNEGGEAVHFQRAPLRERGSALAFGIIGQYGDRSDLAILRRLGQSHPNAGDVMAAIKALDAGSVH